MKEQYVTPLMEIEQFALCEIVNDSETDPTTATQPHTGGIGDANNDGGEI